MHFELSADHQARKAFGIELGTTLNDSLAAAPHDRTWPYAAWTAAAKAGLTGLLIPESYGGQGGDALGAAATLEGLGYGCTDGGFCFALGAHLWGCAMPIALFGTEEQKAALLPGLCDGRTVGALAITEPEAGSDAFHLRTGAQPTAGGYLLSGHKTFITNGPIAGVTLVLASEDPARGAHGLAGFLLEHEAPGSTRRGPVAKMGLTTAQMGELLLEDCFVPATRRLGDGRLGMAIFSHAMEWERGLILAPVVGAMQRQLERCIAYAQQRKQFGRPIGQFQLVASKLVDMHLRWEQARWALYRFAWLKQQGRSAFREAAIAKLTISEAWIASCQDAMQIHGGYGYLSETGLERDLRDALAGRIYSGTSEMQRQVIAQWLGVG